MKVRTIKQIEGTDRDVKFKEGRSLRLLLEKDGMGFSLHKTIIPKGEIGRWHYKHHLEACFCIQGKGQITDVESGKKFVIEKDSIYILDNNDNHIFEAFEDVVLVSVFNPPVKGGEVHQADGSYKK